MRILLDTHIALWAITDSPKLPGKARQLMLNPANTTYFSAASIWEISIKHTLVRKDMPISGSEAARLFMESGYIELPVSSAHAAAIEHLPLHHADPFDRLLIAQARTEPMRLLTHDRKLPPYGATILYV